MSRKTRAVNKEEYSLIINCIQTGFNMEDGTVVKANPRIAMALQCEALLGLRISDILCLKLDQFLQEGTNYFIEVQEQKTGKTKRCFVPLNCIVLSADMLTSGVSESTRNCLISLPEVYSVIWVRCANTCILCRYPRIASASITLLIFIRGLVVILSW